MNPLKRHAAYMDATVAKFMRLHGNGGHSLKWISSCFICEKCGLFSKKGIAAFRCDCCGVPSSEGRKYLAAFKRGEVPMRYRAKGLEGQLTLVQAFGV